MAQSCLTLCDPINYSTPGSLSITNSQSSHPLRQWYHPAISPSSPPAPNPSQHRCVAMIKTIFSDLTDPMTFLKLSFILGSYCCKQSRFLKDYIPKFIGLYVQFNTIYVTSNICVNLEQSTYIFYLAIAILTSMNFFKLCLREECFILGSRCQ